MTSTIDGLYIGSIRPLPPDNRPSAIRKQAVGGPLWLGREGLAGDSQADRRVHGGPDKALHQFPVANYARLAARFPDAAARLVPGSIGENLSVAGWDERIVCLGDVFRLGAARIQLCQPRTPCWKIDARFEADGMAQFIDDQGIGGWYFRVLDEGEVAPGAAFELIERPAPHATLAHFHALRLAARPAPAELRALAVTPGLTSAWVEKLEKRAAWLEQQA